LHDVEIVDSRRVNACQDLGEEVGLLLVVAFQADPVGGGWMTASRSAFAFAEGTILPLA
jgi:hypothetical protein